ncbi:hypothetical protein GCM10010329_09980 [Streptomyces spiroverticillatus]|uniref:Uncharacterized protein n=1 Tax=Streptomyces finlayi TaxID=67296 RepID=A0A919CAL4_9ACTN|nr:hypothetical protein [Streptomyces finlayi]GGZ91571.1 hypothetical protein GCM10010329_09980 [Streptomyces spiroverticillatus]GHC93713.1 hypothetical protein GCM10010334_31100 [Streptomyces finlayi]
MSTTSPSAPGPEPAGPEASGADQTNAAIRRLVDAQTTDGAWPSEEYELLLVEWAAAMRDDATEPVP